MQIFDLKEKTSRNFTLCIIVNLISLDKALIIVVL